MFVQVIQGRVSDPRAMRTAMDRWLRDLAPGAIGWLGTTAGMTDDGQLVALARFASEDAARQNNARPEQDAWWRETAGLFTGEVTFRESSDVVVDLAGDPDRAGFVQVMQGRGSDPDRARDLMRADADMWAAFRPDVIGNVVAMHDGGAYTMAIYFTSEAEAREGEQKEPPAAIRAQMDELAALAVGPPAFFDLKDPWLHSPA